MLGAGVLVYDLCAQDGQTLSDGVKGYPHVPRVAVIVVVAAHLLGVIPPRYDPLHWVVAMKVRQHMKDDSP